MYSKKIVRKKPPQLSIRRMGEAPRNPAKREAIRYGKLSYAIITTARGDRAIYLPDDAYAKALETGFKILFAAAGPRQRYSIHPVLLGFLFDFLSAEPDVTAADIWELLKEEHRAANPLKVEGGEICWMPLPNTNKGYLHIESSDWGSANVSRRNFRNYVRRVRGEIEKPPHRVRGKRKSVKP